MVNVSTAEDLVPKSLLDRIVDRTYFNRSLLRYAAMEDSDLFHATVTCLINLENLDAGLPSCDRDLRLILVPELWERIQPDTRNKLRRVSTTLAEYNEESPPSIFGRLLSPASRASLQKGADDLRQRIKHVTQLNTPALVEQTRFAIAGSRAADHWGPDACVYEPRFVYQVVPVIASLTLTRAQGHS